MTGRCEVRIENHAAAGTPASTRFKTFRWAKATNIVEDLGDAEGVVIRDTEGAPSQINGLVPQLSFYGGPLRLERSDEPLDMAMQFNVTDPECHPDIRALGFAATGLPAMELDALVWRDSANKSDSFAWHEAREGDLIVVTLTSSDGAKTTYWINPTQGFTPVRVRVQDKQGWQEVRTQYAKVAEVWFPTRVDVFVSSYADGASPAKTIWVDALEINRPDQPRELTPSDIGLEPGMAVMTVDRKSGQNSAGKWSGTETVSYSEFAKLLRSGAVSEGPTYREAAARLETKSYAPVTANGSGAAGSRKRPPTTQPASLRALELWEAYVEQFIAKYRLDDQQSQRARLILADSRKRAETYLAAVEGRIASAATQPERDKLLAPVDDVFEHQLKPKLNKLPTRAQRAAAERSQPAPPNKQSP